MRSRGFPVFDADNHLYETQDAFTRYLPPAQEVFKYLPPDDVRKIMSGNMFGLVGATGR